MPAAKLIEKVLLGDAICLGDH
jgi:hypothetical protein